MNKFEKMKSQYLQEKAESNKYFEEKKSNIQKIISHMAIAFRQIVDDGDKCELHLRMEENESKHTLCLCKQNLTILKFQVEDRPPLFRWTIKAYPRSDDTSPLSQEGKISSTASKSFDYSSLPCIDNLYNMIAFQKEALFSEVQKC